MDRTAVKLLLMGQRVISADQMRKVGDVEKLIEEFEQDNRFLRRRITKRLRSRRRRATEALKLERLMLAGQALARDLSAWEQWQGRLRAALEDAIRQIGLALPDHPLLELQVNKAVALAVQTTSPLKIHVNSHTRDSVQRVLVTMMHAGVDIEHVMLTTDYLDDDSCIIETPSGLYQASVSAEVEAFCEGVRAYMGSHGGDGTSGMGTP